MRKEAIRRRGDQGSGDEAVRESGGAWPSAQVGVDLLAGKGYITQIVTFHTSPVMLNEVIALASPWGSIPLLS